MNDNLYDGFDYILATFTPIPTPKIPPSSNDGFQYLVHYSNTAWSVADLRVTGYRIDSSHGCWPVGGSTSGIRTRSIVYTCH